MLLFPGTCVKRFWFLVSSWVFPVEIAAASKFTFFSNGFNFLCALFISFLGSQIPLLFHVIYLRNLSPPRPIIPSVCVWKGCGLLSLTPGWGNAPPLAYQKTNCMWILVMAIECNTAFARKATADSLTTQPDSLHQPCSSPRDLWRCFHKCFHTHQSWCFNINASKSLSKHSSAFKALLDTQGAKRANQV